VSKYPHTLNLNLTIIGEGNNWTEVMVALKDSAAGWEVVGIGDNFLAAIANLLSAIGGMTIVPPEVKAQLLTVPTVEEWQERQHGWLRTDGSYRLAEDGPQGDE
jgi:hypothetical protein